MVLNVALVDILGHVTWCTCVSFSGYRLRCRIVRSWHGENSALQDNAELSSKVIAPIQRLTSAWVSAGSHSHLHLGLSDILIEAWWCLIMAATCISWKIMGWASCPVVLSSWWDAHWYGHHMIRVIIFILSCKSSLYIKDINSVEVTHVKKSSNLWLAFLISLWFLGGGTEILDFNVIKLIHLFLYS